MATFREDTTGREVRLDDTHPFGRAPGGGTPLDEPSVSRLHAVATWNDGFWAVTDLGSRNGTTVSGEALEPGRARALVVGDVVRFGRAPAWRVVELGPPRARALGEDGREILGLDDLLVLPDTDDPAVVVRRSSAGWIAVDGAGERPVRDGDRLEVGNERWRLRLPGAIGSTEAESAEPWRLVLRVDADGERVAACVEHGAARFDLGMRAHHRLLLLLGRERQRAARRSVPASEAGWVACPDLATALGIREQLVYLHLWRLRAQLEALGLPPVVTVLERRLTAEVRVGTEEVLVEPL